MIERKTAIESVEACLKWTENVMLTFDRGYWGVYERIRIDRNERPGGTYKPLKQT